MCNDHIIPDLTIWQSWKKVKKVTFKNDAVNRCFTYICLPGGLLCRTFTGRTNGVCFHLIRVRNKIIYLTKIPPPVKSSGKWGVFQNCNFCCCWSFCWLITVSERPGIAKAISSTDLCHCCFASKVVDAKAM